MFISATFYFFLLDLFQDKLVRGMYLKLKTICSRINPKLCFTLD